jgi:hypothetical protein
MNKLPDPEVGETRSFEGKLYVLKNVILSTLWMDGHLLLDYVPSESQVPEGYTTKEEEQ